MEDLRKSLDETKHNYKSLEECYLLKKNHAAQLEKQLFDINAAKANVID